MKARILISALCPLFLTSCPAFTVRIPIGENARFGYVENSTRYIPPDSFPDITRTPTLGDK